MNKSLMTNIIAAVILIVGLCLTETEFSNILIMVGLFALSGALTNWLAVFMLFEKYLFYMDLAWCRRILKNLKRVYAH